LLENIQGQEIITSITDAIGQDFFIPSFGIDYIYRRASAEAAGHVQGRLGLLVIISINSSISLTTGEVLRPGILCFNSIRRPSWFLRLNELVRLSDRPLPSL
jgi:hypothetical protein